VSGRLAAAAALGAIIVLATHDLDVADGLVTRVAIVRDGRLICDEPGGTDLRRRYRSLVGSV
jgi:ABC-type multidrug transport system ATPase subunit